MENEEEIEFIEKFKKEFFERFKVIPNVTYSPKYHTLQEIEVAANEILNTGSIQFYKEGIKTDWIQDSFLALHKKLYYKIAVDAGHRPSRVAKYIKQCPSSANYHMKTINKKLENDAQTNDIYQKILEKLRVNEIIGDSDKRRVDSSGSAIIA